MAGGKASPRQKMINMMYLVLMAMLALNVSKEVLLAFGAINESINITTAQLSKSSTMMYGSLGVKYENNPEKYKDIHADAMKIKKASNELVSFLDEISKELEDKSGDRDEDGKLPWGNMDDTSVPANVLFPAGSMKNGKGYKLTEMIADYRKLMLTMTSKASIRKQLDNTLCTKDFKTKDGVKIEWVKNKFEHYPLAAAITFISQMKADVRNAESTILSKMIEEGLGEQIMVNKMEALPIATSSTVMKGSSFEAQVMLAAYDSTLEPEMYLWKVDKNGRRLGKSEKRLKLKGGAGVVNIPANSTGEFYWGGVIKVKSDDGSKPKEYKFFNSYSVNEPAVVVSADKMNVLYRGVKNPISISVPGIPANKISATGPGLRKVGAGKWIADVTRYKGRTGNVVVTAVMADGREKQFAPQKYRIKDIPMPMGAIGGQSEISLPASNLAKLPVEARLMNFEFELKLKVVSFSIKIPGKPTFKVKGSRMERKVISALKRVPIGTEISIRDIKVKVPGNSSYKIAKVSPIVVTISGR